MYALKNTLHFKWKISIHMFHEVVKLKHTHTHLISKALRWLYSNWMFVVVLRHYILFLNDRCQIYITSAISHSDQHYCFTALQCHLLNFAPSLSKEAPHKIFTIHFAKCWKPRKYVKVLPRRFHLNGHTPEFHWHTQSPHS